MMDNLREWVGCQRGRWQIYTTGLNWYLLKLVGDIPSQFLRLFIYKNIFGLKLEPQVVIYAGAEMRCPENIAIHSNTIIGNKATLDGRAGITIGHQVNLSSEVAIWTVQHDPQAADFGVKSGRVMVHDYAWLSFRSVILPGVTIGEGAVVAACAVVTKDVEPYTIVAGIPAKKIGERNRDLNYTLAEGYIPFI
jgi:acetyltransferase-like isoleucine patch superfamily enzyme